VLSVTDTLMLITVVPIFCMPTLVEYTGWYSSYHNYGYQLALVHLLPFVFIVQTSTIWVTVLVGINRYIAVCMPYQASESASSAVAGKPQDAVVKFDTYRNLQRHRTVLPAIARLSCLTLAATLKFGIISHIIGISLLQFLLLVKYVAFGFLSQN